jgi:hypothetical protein
VLVCTDAKETVDYQYFVLAEGVLGLRVNLPKFKWSYGITAPPASKVNYETCALRLTLDVGGSEIFSPATANIAAERDGKYHYFSGAHDADLLRYQRTFAFGSMLQLEASGLTKSAPTIRINKTYLKYIKHRFMNLHSIGYILTDVASLLLLLRGLTPVHSSAFTTEWGTALIVAPPNTGKTLTTMMACLDHGASFMSEDLAITDGNDVYAVPWTSTFRYYSKIDDSLRSRFLGRLTNILPIVELLPGARVQPISKYVPAERIVGRAPISHVCILERGERSVSRVDRSEAFRMIANLNRFEFNYHRAPLITAYEYFNPRLDVWRAMEAERATLRKMVEVAPEVLLIKSPSPTEYAETIIEAMRESKRKTLRTVEA